MDIEEDIPTWQQNIYSKLCSRDKPNKQFKTLIEQLEYTKQLFKKSQNHVVELENTLKIMINKKCDDVIKELCETHLKLSNKLIEEMDLQDNIKQLKQEINNKQIKLETVENVLYDTKKQNERMAQELHNTRKEVQNLFDEITVLQLENNCMRTKLEHQNNN